jgi:hypothetical protein
MKKLLIFVLLFNLMITMVAAAPTATPTTTTAAPMLSFNGWDKWGSARLTIISNTEGIFTVSGSTENTASGYVLERELDYLSGRTLVITIGGNLGLSKFDHKKLFKLEINDNPIRTVTPDFINTNDSTYVNASQGTLNFRMPNEVKKINFVFYNASFDRVNFTVQYR